MLVEDPACCCGGAGCVGCGVECDGAIGGVPFRIKLTSIEILGGDTITFSPPLCVDIPSILYGPGCTTLNQGETVTSDEFVTGGGSTMRAQLAISFAEVQGFCCIQFSIVLQQLNPGPPPAWEGWAVAASSTNPSLFTYCIQASNGCSFVPLFGTYEDEPMLFSVGFPPAVIHRANANFVVEGGTC